MSSLGIFFIVFGCIFGGTLLGMFLRTILPEKHLSADSKDVVKLGIGMIATLAALVLGLLIASAKGTFDTLKSEVTQTCSRIIQLDRTMANYGPETRESRVLLRRGVILTVERIWPEEKDAISVAKARKPGTELEDLQAKLRQLVPRNDNQRWLQSRALQISVEIAQTRWLFAEQIGERSIPTPFLVILVCWLTIIFASFGLFSPHNATVIAVLLVCGLSAAGSIFLILELDSPYEGLIKISSAPIHNALVHIGQ